MADDNGTCNSTVVVVRTILFKQINIRAANIEASYIFQPTAAESPGSINESGRTFLSKLGRKIFLHQSGDDMETSFLFQRLSVLIIQRFNAILLHNSFVKQEE